MNSQLNNKLKSGDVFHEIQNKAFQSSTSVIISFLNPFSYYEVSKNKELVEQVDYYFSDGSLLCVLHNLFLEKISRASFDYSSIAASFLQTVELKKKRIAIIGATEKENSKAVNTLQTQYSQLEIVYYRNGYISNIDEVINELNKSCPDVILVGMGTPYQEEFSIKIKEHLLTPTLIITCGGFLTQTSIKPDYYHPLIKKLGLRWLQRMVMHKHVRDRVLKIYPKFICKYVFSMIGAKIAKK